MTSASTNRHPPFWARAVLLLSAILAFINPFGPLMVAHATSPRALQNAPLRAEGSLDWLRVEGNKLVNSAGQTIILRGANVENREWFWDKEPSISYELRAIPEVTRNWGANLITIAFASGPVNRNDQTYLGFIDQLVAAAKSNGAYTLLAYRYSEPDRDQPTMPDQAAEDAIARLADRYSREPAVLYGLQVETHDVTWSQLKPRFTTMVAAIHAKNPRAVIAVPGTNWARYVYQALSDPIPGSNLIYKTHPYDSFSTINSKYRLAEVAQTYPVILGEFGVGSQSSYDDIAKLIDFAEANGISWQAWMFNAIACPCLITDPTSFAPTTYGALVKQRMLAGAAQLATYLSTGPIAASNPAATGPVVFEDALDWNDWSWGTVVNPDVVSPVFEGVKSLGVTYQDAWAALSLNSPGISTASYASLDFAVRPAGQSLPSVYVALYDDADRIMKQVDPRPYATPAKDGWYSLSIPLSALGASGSTITRVQFQESSGRPQPTFYLDGLRLTAPVPLMPSPTVTSSPEPTATATPAPSPIPESPATQAPTEPSAAVAVSTSAPTATATPEPTNTPAPQPVWPPVPSVSTPAPESMITPASSDANASDSVDAAGAGDVAEAAANNAAVVMDASSKASTATKPTVTVSMPYIAIPAGSAFQVPVHLNTTGQGLESVDIEVTYNPTLVQVVAVHPGEAPWNTNAVTFDNSRGRLTVANFLDGAFVGDADIATVSFRSLAPEGVEASLDVHVHPTAGATPKNYTVAGQDGAVLFNPPVKAYVPIRAGNSLTMDGPQALDPQTWDRLPNVHVTHYEGRFLYAPHAVQVQDVQFLNEGITGVAHIDNESGVTALSVSVPEGVRPDNQVRIVVRLTGSVLTSAPVSFVLDSASDGETLFAPVYTESAPMTVRYHRGDVNADGKVDLMDLAVALQHMIGFSPISDVGYLNLASINHDGTWRESDWVDLTDILMLFHYLTNRGGVDL